ncbi:MAG: HAMP domain-containing protein, partial [Jatrophihabitantaceae bacterium]
MTGPVPATPAAPPSPQNPPPVRPVPPVPPPGWNGHWTPAEPPTVDATPARRWRFLPRSLTGRLVTGVVVLVVIVVLSAGAGTYFALRSFLYSRLDQQLIPIAVNNAATAQAQLTDHRPTPDANALFRGNQKVWIAVLTPDGAPSTVIGANVSNTGVEVMHLSSAAAVDLVKDTDSPDTVSTTDGQQLRVSAHRIATPFGELYIVTGLPTDELTATLNRLVELELVIGASAVTLALVATALGVRFSLRHLHRVTSTAQDVAAELSPSGSGLERRVPVTDPGTEVGKLAESMNTLLSTVETQFAARLDSERRMRQFMADASHELRTP